MTESLCEQEQSTTVGDLTNNPVLVAITLLTIGFMALGFGVAERGAYSGPSVPSLEEADSIAVSKIMDHSSDWLRDNNVHVQGLVSDYHQQIDNRNKQRVSMWEQRMRYFEEHQSVHLVSFATATAIMYAGISLLIGSVLYAIMHVLRITSVLK